MRFATILLPTDFGDAAQRATDLAVDFARTFESNLVLVHGFEMPAYAYTGVSMASVVDYLTPIEDAARKQFDEEVERLSKMWPRSSALFLKGPTAKQILRACEQEHADLIVMGTHGRTGLSHAFLGSIAEKIVRLATVPVLTVRGAVKT